MRCHDVRDRLMSYIDGRLAEPDASVLETHLEACPRCRREYEAEVELVTAFRTDVTGLAGEGFLAGVERRIDRTPTPVAAPVRVIRLRRAAAAAAVLVAFIAFGLLSEDSDAIGTESELTGYTIGAAELARGVVESAESFTGSLYETGSATWRDAQSSVHETLAPHVTLIAIGTAAASLLCAALVLHSRRSMREVLHS